MAVKVYGWAVSPFVARVLLCLEEGGADYELVAMEKSAGDHKKPEFLARNPFGQVPVLEDGGLTLFESRAISRHVLRKYKPELLKQGDLKGSAAVDVWLEVEAHQYDPAVLAVAQQCLVFPLTGRIRDQKVVNENMEKLKNVLEVYEARLSKFKYLAGDFISLADLSHFPCTHYFMATEYASVLESYPCVKAWWEDLLARPSVKTVEPFMPLDFGLKKIGTKPMLRE